MRSLLARLRALLVSVIAAIGRPRSPSSSSGTPPADPPYMAELVITGDTSVVATHTTDAYGVAALDQNGLPFAGAPGPYTWTSGTPAKATIDAVTSLATGVAAGTSAITARATNSRGSVITSNALTLTVAAQVATTVTVTPPSASLVHPATQQLTATVKDQSAIPNVIVGATGSWSSGDTGKATVSVGGLVTTVADTSGTPVGISFTSGSAVGTSLIAVSATPSTVTAVAIRYNSVTATQLLLRTGTAYSLVAVDQDGNTLSSVGTWSADDATNFPINSSSGSVTPITAAAAQGVTFTYTHTATGHTATCTATAILPTTPVVSDKGTNYANTTALMGNIWNYLVNNNNGVNPTYNSNVPTGPSNAKYVDGYYVNQYTIDSTPSRMFMGEKVFNLALPTNGGGAALYAPLGPGYSVGLTRAWVVVIDRYDPGFTTTGTGGSPAAAYKMCPWFLWQPGFNGRVGPEFTNTNGIDLGNVLQDGSNQTLGGRLTQILGTAGTSWDDGLYRINVLLYEQRSGNIMSARYWRSTIGVDVGSWLTNGGTVSGLVEGPMTSLTGTPPSAYIVIPFGANYNRGIPAPGYNRQVHSWEVIDGATYGDPLGILGTQATPTLSGVSGGTVTQGDTNVTITLTGANFNDNCSPVFSNSSIRAQSIVRTGSTQFAVTVSLSATATTGAGTVTIYNAASQVSSGTQAVTVQALAAPNAPTASNATGVAFNTLTFPVTLAASGTIPTSLAVQYSTDDVSYTQGASIPLSGVALGDVVSVGVSLPAASTLYYVKFASSSSGGTSSYATRVTGTTAAPAAVITTNQVLRIMADAGLDVSTDGAGVGSATDQSPAALGAVLLQGTGTKQPILRTAVYNGHNAMRFTSANQSNLTSTAAISSLNTDAVTVYVVCASLADNPSGSQRFWNNYSANGGAAYEGFHVTHTGSTNTANLFAGPLIGGAVAQVAFSTAMTVASGLHILTATLDHGTGTLITYYDGVLVNTVSRAYNTQTTAPTVVSLGSQNGSSSYLDGDISDFIQYNVAHTASQVAQNVAALKTRYGIS